MKNKALKLYLSLFCSFSNFLLFAIPPGDDNVDGTLEGNDAPAAPINGKIIFLAVAGVLFAFYTLKKRRQHQTV
ncbi:hypothetical protein [Flavobacterium sp. DSR3-2]|uniref:hypothetical protein n=1 Tax=Flavobacterium sp. DSR3-2 TaxID=2804634 RepID=UPI003CF1FB10